MRNLARLILVLSLFAVAGCESKFKTYNGPEVTRVIVFKGDRQMYLMHHDRVLKKYRVDLGFDPLGHKQVEGDGRTPEGEYLIDRRNPNSDFYLSIGISYPNEEDVARAEALGLDPGGDIFIHGQPNKKSGTGPDWTAGCISVRDREMRDIYAMVKDGTPITLIP